MIEIVILRSVFKSTHSLPWPLMSDWKKYHVSRLVRQTGNFVYEFTNVKNNYIIITKAWIISMCSLYIVCSVNCYNFTSIYVCGIDGNMKYDVVWHQNYLLSFSNCNTAASWQNVLLELNWNWKVWPLIR